jgi:hypothetical protein
MITPQLVLACFIAIQVAVLAYQDSDSTNQQIYTTGYAMSASACIGLFFSVTTIVAPMIPFISRPHSARWLEWHRTSLRSHTPIHLLSITGNISLIACVVCFIAQLFILISGIQIPSESYQAGITVAPLIPFVRKVISRRKPDEAIQAESAHTQPRENQASEGMNADRANPTGHKSTQRTWGERLLRWFLP